MKKLIYAVRFLTILPVRWRGNEDLADVARSISVFPVVGLLIAAGVWASSLGGTALFSETTGRILALAVWIVATGALHLDGLADSADGVLGGRSVESRLSIMRDSRIGTFGVVAILLVIGAKAAFLLELEPGQTGGAIITAAVSARLSQVMLIAAFPSARPEGLGAFFREHLRGIDIGIAAILGCALVWAGAGIWGVVLLVSSLGVAMLFGLWFRRKLGGLTGDVYGAITEILETIILAAAVLVEMRPW